MMGHHDRSEALFCYFRLEDQVPETHLLRLIDKHISFEFVREQLKDSYSENGRRRSIPSFCCASCWHHQRTQTGEGTAHASGVALVYPPGLRESRFVQPPGGSRPDRLRRSNLQR